SWDRDERPCAGRIRRRDRNARGRRAAGASVPALRAAVRRGWVPEVARGEEPSLRGAVGPGFSSAPARAPRSAARAVPARFGRARAARAAGGRRRRSRERCLVVSEYAPGVEPAPWRFPARNRIIAGLAAATVIVEARERSGALITADFALEAGREVFAVPGEITSALSAGTNALLRLGATPLTRVSDVLDPLGIQPARREPAELGDHARTVLAALAE